RSLTHTQRSSHTRTHTHTHTQTHPEAVIREVRATVRLLLGLPSEGTHSYTYLPPQQDISFRHTHTHAHTHTHTLHIGFSLHMAGNLEQGLNKQISATHSSMQQCGVHTLH